MDNETAICSTIGSLRGAYAALVEEHKEINREILRIIIEGDDDNDLRSNMKGRRQVLEQEMDVIAEFILRRG